MGKKLTQEEAILQLQETRGSRYDYSMTNYMGASKNIDIICKEHGIFNQRYDQHKSGANCKKCSHPIKSNKVVIEELINKHGDIYDYSLVEYSGVFSKIKIICKVHGIFEQTATTHLFGSGCPDCANNTNKHSLKKVLLQFQEKHGDRYDYNLVKYITTEDKVKIICKEHGVFEQSPHSHISGKGCRQCYEESRRKPIEKVISDFNSVHNGLYDYSLITTYKNAMIKLPIICKAHGIFHQSANTHFNNKGGCPYCADRTNKYTLQTYKDRKTILYYIKIGDLYKIGITLHDINRRFRKDIKNGVEIEIIKIWEFSDGAEAYVKEQDLLFEYAQHRYFGAPILVTGNSELFIKDALLLN